MHYLVYHNGHKPVVINKKLITTPYFIMTGFITVINEVLCNSVKIQFESILKYLNIINDYYPAFSKWLDKHPYMILYKFIFNNGKIITEISFKIKQIIIWKK